MAKYLSPGVYPRTVDLSNLVPAVSTAAAGIVGYSDKGSLDLMVITSRSQFLAEYGNPTVGNFFHYAALAFLENGSVLYCKRVISEDALYSGANVVESTSSLTNYALTTGLVTKALVVEDSVEDLFTIVAKDPGSWGDNISFTITEVIADDATADEVDQYTFKINVYYTSDGTTTLVESWKVSRQTKIDGYGKQLYLQTRINNYSRYIEVYDNTAIDETVVPAANAVSVNLGGGDNGTSIGYNDLIGDSSDGTGWNVFYNKDNADVQILIGGSFTQTIADADTNGTHQAAIAQELKTICEHRRDCIALVDVPYNQMDNSATIKEYRSTYLTTANSSYVALYAPWVTINDPYNDKIIEVPASGYVASQIAYNDRVQNPWDAPAGYDVGILNVLGLTTVFSQGDRDVLYPSEVNCLQTCRGAGHIIWGQKTLQRKDSALKSLNVRRSINMIEQSMARSLQAFTFKPNNEMTRFRIQAILEEYLDEIASRGAFQTEGGDRGFRVVCDETNNTPIRIDSGELWVDVFVKPVRSAEYIQLTTIVTKSGTSFQELVSRGSLF